MDKPNPETTQKCPIRVFTCCFTRRNVNSPPASRLSQTRLTRFYLLLVRGGFADGARLAQRVNEQLDRLLYPLLPAHRGLMRIAPEWLWRDFRLRLSRGRNPWRWPGPSRGASVTWMPWRSENSPFLCCCSQAKEATKPDTRAHQRPTSCHQHNLEPNLRPMCHEEILHVRALAPA